MRESRSTFHSHYLSADSDLPLANAKANAVVGCERENAGDPPSPGFTRGERLIKWSVLAAASTITTRSACLYAAPEEQSI
jgi:hypothetical protein